MKTTPPPFDPNALLQQAVHLHQSGRLEEAKSQYQQLIRFFPKNADVVRLLGTLECQLGNFKEGARLLGKAITLAPQHPEAYNNRGNALKELRQFRDALICFDRAIALQPEYADAHFNRGNVLRELDRYDEALSSYDQTIALVPTHAGAYINRSDVLKALGQIEAALASVERAIALQPDYPPAHYNHGNLLRDLGRFQDAQASYDRAITLQPNYIEALLNGGNVLRQGRQYVAALSYYDKALQCKPDYADAWLNRGNVFREMRQFDEAVANFNRAATCKPNFAEAWSAAGNVYRDLGRYPEAIEFYDRALKIRPDFVDGWVAKSRVLVEQERFAEAVICQDRALKINPDAELLLGSRCYARLSQGDWRQAAERRIQVLQEIKQGRKASAPLELLCVTDSMVLQRRLAESYVRDAYPANAVLGDISPPANHEKIRIGYFSADFHNHPVSFLTAELYEHHDRSRFHVTAFSFGAASDAPIRARLRQAFDEFIDVQGLSGVEIARLAREREIDIAVDLGGHTANCRTDIFASRAAPVQVNYLGYPGTMGADFMDYIIGDPVVIPALTRDLYTEKVIYLPCFQANDSRREISSRVFSRAELGLPREGVVYCCFNNNYKFTPEVFDAWMRILTQVEGSVLYLYQRNDQVAANLRREAALRGVDPGRLVFGGALPAAEYLSRYRVADLFLDTLPFNAGTTASDALWSGLPVLTCAGEAFASRMAASLLHAVGLPELVTETLEAYEREAVALGRDPERLSQLKRRLVEERSRALLFDSVRFTRKLEQAYEAMYQRQQSGLAPEHIDVTEQGPV